MAKNLKNRRGMSGKLKKAIIAVVIIFALSACGLVAFSFLSKMSTTTVYDLRIVEFESKKEIFDKEVFLTADENNNFEIDLDVSASAITNFVFSSSDNSVASVSVKDDHYVVSYFKVGEVKIVASAYDNSKVRDSFVLTVRENYPISFKITDSRRESENEISIYADLKEYQFDFLATSIDDKNPVNNETFSILDDYNKDVFESIRIDPATSKIVIKANKNREATREFVTVVCKTTNEETGEKTIQNFLLIVNVKGFYIENLQLVLSTKPNFDNAVYVCGEGKLKEENNEKRVSQDRLVFCEDVNIVYVQVRIVFTNGDFDFVTEDAVSSKVDGVNSSQIQPGLKCFELEFTESAKDLVNVNVQFKYTSGSEYIEKTFTFYYYSKELTENGHTKNGYYEDFINNKLYEKYTEDENEYYRYVHWDERYKRTDTITATDGKIIGFINDAPTCESESKGN